MSDAPEGKRWPVTKIDALIRIEQAVEPCWRVQKYLGSMLTFDFGKRVEQQGPRGPYQIGTSTLGVRNCFWTVDTGSKRLDSEDADHETSAVLTAVFRQSTLLGCERRRTWMSFAFSNRTRLNLDLTRRYSVEDDEAIASLGLGGGAFFELLWDGSWTLILSASRQRRSAQAA